MDNKHHPEDIRAEYSAITSYHTSLVTSRFTIAGLYVAAIGFIASAVLSNGATDFAKIFGSLFAIWLTICLWILELRSRCLYGNVAHRGIEIEHEYWGLKGQSWYRGFFSRQYKEPPSQDDQEKNKVPPQPAPDAPRLGWARKPLPEAISKYVSHSMGLDLLYAGSAVFWFGIIIYTLID